MNDEMIRLGVFALLGGFGGLVRYVARGNESFEFSAACGHILVGACFALILPSFCSLAMVVIGVVRYSDITVAGGTALLVGLFAKSVLAWLDGVLGLLAPQSTYLRKFLGFPKRKK